jgi:hypothetical protein
VHRRNFIAGIPAIWLAAATAPAHAIERDPTIDEAIADLVRRLERLHGEKWFRLDDGTEGYVMLRRRPSETLATA